MSSADEAVLQRFRDVDAALVSAGKGIKVLSYLAWPFAKIQEFLESWQRGNPQIPVVEYPRLDLDSEETTLRDVLRRAREDHPIAEYLRRSADDCLKGIALIRAVGKPEFTGFSRELYGDSSEMIFGSKLRHVDAARKFLSATQDISDTYRIDEKDYCVSANVVAADMRKACAALFVDDPIEIVVDAGLNAKAAAGATRIRLRAQTAFSEEEIGQLINHEAYVHSLTAINGRRQPCLQSFSLGLPRTTKTQEGLATFSELISKTMDLARLRRIALRVVAIDMALNGADFLEIFKFFTSTGQTESESAHSTVRIFRGGDPRGGVVFTKDAVYLNGLILVHTFLRKALQANKFGYAQNLFAGKLTVADVILLEPYFDTPFISRARYLPPWLVQKSQFAAQLNYSVFANSIMLDSVDLGDFAHSG